MDDEFTQPLEAIPPQPFDASGADEANLTAEASADQPEVQRADNTSSLQEWPVGPASVEITGGEVNGDRAPAIQVITTGVCLRSRYVLEEIIGRGGESIVYRARDLHRSAPQGEAASLIAIKLLLPRHRANPRALERLKREFRQMQSLTHPGVVRVFDLDCDGDVWFMTMELVAGPTLKLWMENSFQNSDAMKLITACCEAVEYAHSMGMLHGDLKPANILITPDCGIKLIDFGSTLGPGALTSEGRDPSGATTPAYASPQVLEGDSPERVDDVFSLACVSYELFSRGAKPYAAASMVEARRDHVPLKYDVGIPLRLFEVIAAGLALEREGRPKTALTFLHRLTSSESSQYWPPADGTLRASAREPAAIAAVPPSQPIADDHDLLFPPIEGTPLTSDPKHRSITRIRRLRVAVAGLVAAVLVTQAWRSLVAHPGDSRSAPPVPAAQTLLAMTPIMAVPLVAEPPPLFLVLPPDEDASRDAGVITFDVPAVTASAAQPVVALLVKRLHGTRGNTTVAWQVQAGSAQSDLENLRAAPHILRFFSGQSASSLFIPLKSTTSTSAHGLRNFTVALRAVRGGAAIGPVARVTVTLLPVPGMVSKPMKLASGR